MAAAFPRSALQIASVSVCQGVCPRAFEDSTSSLVRCGIDFVC
jgi:hypothetical protein